MMMKRTLTGVLAALLAALCLLSVQVLAAEPEALSGELVLESRSEPVPLPEEEEANDALFSEYVLRQFYGPESGVSPLSAQDPARDRLGERERMVYDLLRPKLIAVAENGGNTRFSFSLEDLGMKPSWTREELAALDLPTSGGDQEINYAIQALLRSDAYRVDGQAVRSALLADLPYELYWFDKTVEAASGFQASVSWPTVNGAWTGSLDFSSSTVAFDFPAAQSYQDPSAGEEAALYTVKSDVAAVKEAAANARTIVEKFRKEDDYTKLLGYRSEICDLVDYNHDAAAGGTAYGDPWQLVWVFDGDDTTKVVCEGYSKAFQYLCDLTEFSGRVDCYTVEGIMWGATGQGPHMWNIVRINGRNYLADVTNSDAGSAGQDGGLFLAGARLDTATTPPSYTVTLQNGGSIMYSYETGENLWGNDVLLTLEPEDYDPSAEPPPATQSAVGGVKVENGTLTLRAEAAEKARLLAAAYDRNRRFLDTVLLRSLEPGETYEDTLDVPAEAVYFQALLTGGENGSPLCPAQAAE